MPTYEFYCDPDEGGCGHVIEITCSYSDKDKSRPKSCPKCRKRKALIEIFGGASVFIPKTLGHSIDKNSAKISEDEKHHLNNKHNEYKKSDNEGPSWIATDNGMVHRDTIRR